MYNFTFRLEKQLQEVSGDMTLGIPYWDSTLDVLLPRPCDSVLFSDEMLGPSNGFVTSGPFANFRYPEGSLMRNCQGNRTIRPSDLMLFRSFVNYTQCCYCVSSTLELVHGTVHVFVNGIMNNLNRASFDPCFWLHHSFIDKLYEDIQVNFKVKPSNANFTSSRCLNKGIDGLDEPMLPFGSRDNKTGQIIGLKNRDGLLPRYTLEDYSYAPSPNCADKTCTGKYLYCDLAGICKSRIRNGGICDQQAVDLYDKNGTNACLDGSKCQILIKYDKYRVCAMETSIFCFGIYPYGINRLNDNKYWTMASSGHFAVI
uniref:Tyrosinase copper-binding domain-containing protein n=1 Tax=Romanomermis culicivorax TaxID=13658 RepID=A0A915JYT0_ROMCU